jgi:hypothetical protein
MNIDLEHPFDLFTATFNVQRAEKRKWWIFRMI